MKLSFTAKAVSHVDDIFDYITASNPTAALAVIGKIDRAIQGLLQFPACGRLGRVVGTRELVIPSLPYIVVYAVREEAIEIVAVLHGARDWPSSFDV